MGKRTCQIALLGAWVLLSLVNPALAGDRKPNLVVILAEDVGYGDLGCFGQKTLKTPRLDEMAREGMRLTQFYAGSSVCSPSRTTLLTGRHSGRPTTVPPRQTTVASLLKEAGYATAWIGKWDVHASDTLTSPNDLGFGHFFGAINAAHARNPYPEFLIRDGKAVPLKNEAGPEWKKWQDPKLPEGGQGVAVKRVEYAPDLIVDDALGFIRENEKKPFFLLLSLPAPQAKGDGKGIDVPDRGEFAKRDWPEAEKAFAALVHNIDRDTGRVLDLLKELKLEKDTLVLFTSANGPSEDGGHKVDHFQSTGKHRGLKGDPHEGGIRVPTIAWRPGTVTAASQNDLQWYAGDLLATAAELAGVKAPAGLDSDSLVAALLGKASEDRWHRKSPLYWESNLGRGWQVVRFGKWKAIRSPLFTGEILLYDMSNDPAEKNNYALRRPDLARHANNLFNKHHPPDPKGPGDAPGDASSAVFQYAVPVAAGNKKNEAFLWIPPAAKQVRGVVMAGMTLAEREIVKDPAVRRACADESLAVVFLRCGLSAVNPQTVLDDFAKQSGYRELSVAPLFFIGHSAGGPQAKDRAIEYASRTSA